MQTAMAKVAVPPGFKDVTGPKRGPKRKQDEVKATASTRPAKKIASRHEKSAAILMDNNFIDDLSVFDVPGAGRLSPHDQPSHN